MDFRSTIRSAITSYGSVVSAMITGLLTIRLATHHLSKEEFGLWSFTMQTVGYFMMLELGMSGSGTRLLGEPLARNDQTRMNSWFSLSILALGSQALLILVLGWIARPWILQWFEIPGHLLDTAAVLWIAFLAIQSGGLVFKLSFAILYAQNRVYWTNALQTGGLWITLAAFAVLLESGVGLMAYVWSAGISTLLVSLGGLWAVLKGKDRFRLTFSQANPGELIRMFRFSGAVFFVGLAAQIYAASQGLITTKILGLEAAAVLAVTMRSATLATSFVWRPFDAFSPRWQIAYCNGATRSMADEFAWMTRITLLLSVTAACAVMLFNRPFVLVWTKPEYFGGTALTLFAGIAMIIQSICRCYAAPFILTMRLRAYIWITIGSIVTGISLMTLLSRAYGLAGIPAGIVITELLFPLWFYVGKGGGAILASAYEPLLADARAWLPALLFGAAGSWIIQESTIQENLKMIAASTLFLLLAAPLCMRCVRIVHRIRFSQNHLAGDNSEDAM